MPVAPLMPPDRGRYATGGSYSIPSYACRSLRAYAAYGDWLFPGLALDAATKVPGDTPEPPAAYGGW